HDTIPHTNLHSLPTRRSSDLKSRWFVERDYDKLLLEDVKLKDELKDKLKSAGVSAVEIERPGNKLRIIIKTARPGIIIGRKGAEDRKSTRLNSSHVSISYAVF